MTILSLTSSNLRIGLRNKVIVILDPSARNHIRHVADLGIDYRLQEAGSTLVLVLDLLTILLEKKNKPWQHEKILVVTPAKWRSGEPFCVCDPLPLT